jgi:hypothetical protein
MRGFIVKVYIDHLRSVVAIVKVGSDDTSLATREKIQETAICEDLDATLIGQLYQIYGVGNAL